ncbi:hypothetical protein F2Q70_00031142 [Brassica cretica]|uniref:Uncharacterized protein n=1 Tax=Brassica cretica TaxID=69181 RepID=A0A8S9FKC9_BRACR|nr:hypothetical protein F2Q70_00031142 [Brassica cretica]
MGPPSPVLTSSDFDSRDLYPEELATSSVDSKASPLYHRLLSALISEDSLSINEDVHVDGFGAMHDLDEDSEFSVLNDNGFRNNDDYESEDANGEHDNLEEDTEPIFDFSQLQIPDNLGGPEFDAQPGDISSWFNMDDDEDFDIMELGVPMDDLSGLNIKL